MKEFVTFAGDFEEFTRDHPSTAETLLKTFAEQQAAIATVAMHKEPANMTIEEIVAMCVMGGAEIGLIRDGDRYGFGLKHRCGLHKVNGKFEVVERRN